MDSADRAAVKPEMRGESVRAIHQIHINKTGGTTVGKALGLKFRHADASELIAELGAGGFDTAFIFSFVRNPWDRAVSHYHWRIKTNQTGLGETPIPFKDWIFACFDRRELPYYDKPRMFRQQTDWLKGGSDAAVHPAVDFIGRFETFHEDIMRLSELLGISVSDIPHLKPSDRNRDYRPYYDDQTTAIIAKAFATDIATFDYSFH